MRYLKTLPRRFKNGFREGAYSDTDGVRATRFPFGISREGPYACEAAASARRGRAGLRDHPAHPSPMGFGIVVRRASARARGGEGRGLRRGDRTVTRGAGVARRTGCGAASHGPLACRVSTTRPSRPTPRPSRPDHSPPVAARSLARCDPISRCPPRPVPSALTSPPRRTIRLPYRHGGRLQEARRLRLNGISVGRSRWAHREVSF